MLDIKKVGLKISSLRRMFGYTQESLADILLITPQAISKWENGHTLPETQLLPVLAQIFECSVDEIIMPAYSADEIIENEKIKSTEPSIGLSDKNILSAVSKLDGEIHRDNPVKTDRSINTNITVSTADEKINLLEKVLFGNDIELHRFLLFSEYNVSIPKVYDINFEKKSLLIESLSENYTAGFDFEKVNPNIEIILKTIANMHLTFWDNYEAFGKIGVPWHTDNPNNVKIHLTALENDYKHYKENTILSSDYIDCYEYALEDLPSEYKRMLETRIHVGKNITVLHGDLHPGHVFTAKDNRDIKLIDLEAVRMGICTEDLAMLIALHIEPDVSKSMPLLKYYYSLLNEKVTDYSFDTFMHDYKVSVMESLFFPIRLFNRGIMDYKMRDKSVIALKTLLK